MKIAPTTASPAQRSARALRKAKAAPSGIAVEASPKLWIRSASRAMLPGREWRYGYTLTRAGSALLSTLAAKSPG